MFVENENIPLVTHQDEDCKAHHDDEYDDNSKPNATVEETRFTTQSASKLLLRLKVKQNKVASLNRHLNVTGDVDFNQSRWSNLYQKSQKKVLQFYIFKMVINKSFGKSNRQITCTNNLKSFIKHHT